VETQYGSLTVKADRSWIYTAVNSADHEQPDYETSLDDSFTYQVIDNDGDLIGNSATQVITVTDTVPEYDD
ncbi:Ig-like domain-containing protein, partial [Psychromonas aquatilis]